ncbi:carbonic anhydrase, partial [Gaertneriomyces semiglobifer]
EMQKFLRGFRRFHKTYFHENTSLFSKLQHGQAPKTLLIGCCDSRCDPAIITDCDPGDLFVIRNVANLVPPYIPNEDQRHHGTSAAVEFAVKGLGVETIIVLGHTACGGINALMNTDLTGKNYEFISSWMAIATPAKERTLREFADADEETQRIACEHASILLSLENLMGYPFIRERLDKDQISVNGWYFDFKRGDLMAYNPDTHAFETMATPESPERQGSGRDVARKASVRDVGGTACALPVP